MFWGRNSNNRINHLHERSLRIVYNEYESLFQKLLELNNLVSVHDRNIRLLGIELFNIFRMVLFGTAHGCGGKDPPPYNLSHLFYNDKTWRSYILLKKGSKNIWVTWHNPWFLLTLVFFQQKTILLYQEIQIQIALLYIISNSFNFFLGI